MQCVGCDYWSMCSPAEPCLVEEANDCMAEYDETGFGSVAIVVHDDPGGSKKVRDLFAENSIPSALFHPDLGIPRQMSMATTMCCSYAVLTNKKLWAQQKVVVKALATGKYEVVRFSSLAEYMKRHLDRFFTEIGHC